MRCLTRVTQLIFFISYRADFFTKMALFMETSINSINIFRKVTDQRKSRLKTNTKVEQLAWRTSPAAVRAYRDLYKA